MEKDLETVHIRKNFTHKKTFKKFIVTNGIIETYEYESLNTAGPCIKYKDRPKEGEGKYSEENYIRRQQIRRDTIRRLITQNFDTDNSKFITLTFRDNDNLDIRSVSDCNKEFKKFIQRMRYRYSDFEYVTVLEFQDKNKRGAVHYHMICNLPYVKKSELAKIWSNGFVKINAIDKVDNLGAYVIKYMTKENADTRLKGLKAYNCSKGLKRPSEFKSWGSMDEFMVINQIENELKEKKPVYSAKYTSENSGEITYQQFNLHRNSNAK